MDYPAEISNDRAARLLTIVWQDGARQQWPHAQLRAHCKCTQCQSRRVLGVSTDLDDQNTRVDEMQMIGHYGRN